MKPSLTTAEAATLSPSSSLFREKWWLDIVTGGNWAPLRSQERSGVRADMPLYIASYFGQTAAVNPPLTRTLSLFDDMDLHRDLNLRVIHAVMDDLIEGIPGDIPAMLTFDPVIRDLYPFHLRGYAVGVEYTFRLDTSIGAARLWEGLRGATRNKIRKSRQLYEVSVDTDHRRFETLYVRNLLDRGSRLHWPREIVGKLVAGSIQRERGTILVCNDKASRPAAAVFLVHDRNWCYLHLQTLDRAAADKGAMALLVWEAITWAAERGISFDFDTPDFFARQFGAVPTARLTAQRLPLARGFLFRAARKIARTRGVTKHSGYRLERLPDTGQP